jgi:hypothetical protein
MITIYLILALYALQPLPPHARIKHLYHHAVSRIEFQMEPSQCLYGPLKEFVFIEYEYT